MKKLKRLAWFLFKSPQRKLVGWSSLFTDVRGICNLLWNCLGFRHKHTQEIWVCTGLLNRSQHYLDVLLPSLMEARKHGARIALSIADCGSTDNPDLEAAIKAKWDGTLVFSSVQEPFARSRCFNRAIRQARGELLFICDADMSVPASLDKLLQRYVGTYLAWAPVCRKMLGPNPGDGWKYQSEGTGILACNRKHLERSGMLDERITTWGGEDWDLFFRLYRAGIMPLRTRCRNLVHHYHPSLKPADFKPVF
ncbi:MAG: hypothetical protein KJS92_08385 [Bacteroidetes bacterium]|nr:hypothetical protein [Bacteroidota bacterium]